MRQRDEGLAGATDDFYEAFNGLVRFYQFRDRDRSCCGGLTVTECHVLEATLAEAPPSISELGAALRMNKSTASRAVVRLEGRGLVRRHDDAANHRTWRVVPTPRGRAAHTAIVRGLKAEQRALLGTLAPEERRRFTELLRALHTLAARRTGPREVARPSA